MPYELCIERHAEKDLKKLETVLFDNIVKHIKGLSDNPHPQGSRKITGYKNDWRLRVGDYRVIYEIDNKSQIITIMRVKHRKDVYRDL